MGRTTGKSRNNNQNANPDIHFRYSNQIIYYTIFFAGALVLAVIGIYCFTTFLKFIGLDVDNSTINPFWDENKTLWYIIFISSVIVLLLAIWLIPFFLALKATDKKGTAKLHEDKIVITIANKAITILYYNIENIKFTTVSPFKTGGPPLYRLRIELKNASKKRYLIQCSFKEAWQCRKKKTKPLIHNLGKKLSKKLNLEMEYTTNIWG